MDSKRLRDLVVRCLLNQLESKERRSLQRELEKNGVWRDAFLRANQHFQRELAQKPESEHEKLAFEASEKAFDSALKRELAHSAKTARRTVDMDEFYEAFVEKEAQERSRHVKLAVISTIAVVVLGVFVVQGLIVWSNQGKEREIKVDSNSFGQEKESGVAQMPESMRDDYLESDTVGDFEEKAEPTSEPNYSHALPSMFTDKAQPAGVFNPDVVNQLKGKSLEEMVIFSKPPEKSVD